MSNSANKYKNVFSLQEMSIFSLYPAVILIAIVNELCIYYMSQMYKSITVLLYILVNIHFQKWILGIKYNR